MHVFGCCERAISVNGARELGKTSCSVSGNRESCTPLRLNYIPFPCINPDKNVVYFFLQRIKMKTLAILLIVTGLCLTIITGIQYIRQEKVAPEQSGLTVDTDEVPVPWSPFLGLLLLTTGGSILIYTRKKKVIT